MHDRALDGTRKLVVRISDPSRKQNRTGALYDGRQVFVTNVPWRATEEEVTALFSKHGKVEKVRIPLKVDGTALRTLGETFNSLVGAAGRRHT